MELTAPPARIRGAVAVAGATALFGQVVLLREILASSHGNELVLGGVMAAWLGLTALATVLGGRAAGPAPVAATRLGIVLALAPLALLGALWLTGFATAGLAQEPSVSRVAVAAVLALVPASAVGGLAFAFAAAADGQRDGLAVYVADTLGAAVAGLAFHFVLAERFTASWLLLGAGAVSAAAGGALAWPRRRIVVLAAGAVLLAAGARPSIEQALAAARFPGERVLALEPSRYGLSAVVARGEQMVFFHDGVLLFTSEDALAAEETTHLPLLLHPRPRKVLMVGGGLGGGLAAALAHRPEQLDYAELDPTLLALARRYADSATRAALVDPRVNASSGDARAVLRGSPGRYDVVLIHLPVPQNALAARWATRECFGEARAALAPGGILVLVTAGADAHLDAAARLRHASLWATVSAVFPAVGVAPGADTLVWASAEPVSARADDLEARMSERGLRPRSIGRTWLAARLLPFHADRYRRALAATVAVENRDFRPVVYLFGLLEQAERLSPGLARAARWAVGRPLLGWAVAAALAVTLALGVWWRRTRGAPGFAAAAAGGTGMALELVLLLAFQALAGHLYHAVGLLLASFMAGMAAGAWQARRWRRQPHALAWSLVVLAGAGALLPPLLGLAARWPGAGAALVAIAVLGVGLAAGSVYPLAVAASSHRRAAAHLYAWDLAGAALAAVLVSLVGVPLLGLTPVAWLSAALCAGAALANVGRRAEQAGTD